MLGAVTLCAGAYFATIWQRAEDELQAGYKREASPFKVRTIMAALGTIVQTRTAHYSSPCEQWSVIFAEVAVEEPKGPSGKAVSFYFCPTEDNKWLENAVGARIVVTPKLASRPYLRLTEHTGKGTSTFSVGVFRDGSVRRETP